MRAFVENCCRRKVFAYVFNVYTDCSDFGKFIFHKVV